MLLDEILVFPVDVQETNPDPEDDATVGEGSRRGVDDTGPHTHLSFVQGITRVKPVPVLICRGLSKSAPVVLRSTSWMSAWSWVRPVSSSRGS